jgi:hypothetical protein
MPAGCGMRVASASIDKLVIKFPTFADIQRQSGLVSVANVLLCASVCCKCAATFPIFADIQRQSGLLLFLILLK